MNVIANAGWHLSNFKSISRIKLKLNSVAHQEYNSPIVRVSIAERVALGLPTEFGHDRISELHAQENRYLQTRRRILSPYETSDEEFMWLNTYWSRFASKDDIAVGIDAVTSINIEDTSSTYSSTTTTATTSGIRNKIKLLKNNKKKNKN